MRCPANPAASYEAVVSFGDNSSSPIFVDGRTIMVTFRVRDLAFHVQAAPTSMRASLDTPVLLTNLAPAPEARCSTNALGLCQAVLSVPEEWFLVGAATTVNVVAAPAVGSLTSSFTNVPVQLAPRHVTAFENRVLFELPSKALRANEQFVVPVHGHAMFPIATFSFKFSAPSGVSIDAVQADDKWSLVVVRETASSVVVDAMLANADGVQAVPVKPELLFSIASSVTSSPSGTVAAAWTVELVFLSNIVERATPTVFVADREGVRASSIGSLWLTADVVAGVLPYFERGSVANFAVLDGRPIRVVLVSTVVHTSGAISVVAPSSCQLGDQTVGSMSGCDALTLSGDETSGTEQTDVTVNVAGRVAVVPVRVWYPTLPVTVLLADDTLNRVRQFEACATKFQATSVRVEAIFRAGSQRSPSIDVLARVASQVASNNASVATVSVRANGAGQVVGVHVAAHTAGSADVQVQRGGRMLGSASVQVVDDFVDILLLQAFTLHTASLTPQVDCRQPAEEWQVRVRPQMRLTQKIQRGQAYVQALYTDGHSRELDDASELLWSSSNTQVVRMIDGARFEAVGTGAGYFVQVQWKPQECNNVTLASGRAAVDVVLPNPDRAQVDQYTAKLTAPGNAAPHVGVPTSTGLRVRLWFGTRAQDMTADPRTIYNTSEAADLFTVDAQQRIVANTAGRLGTGRLRVHFAHVQVEQTISITLIGAESASLTARPRPAYPGSTSGVADELNPIAATGVQQEAQLALTVRLTDGQQFDVSSHAQTSYQVQPAGVVTLGSGSTRHHVARASAGVNGTVAISGLFAGVATTTAFELTVSDTPVVVTALGPVGFVGTLAGLAGTRSKASLAATFSDGTQYTSLFGGSVGSPTVALPGLVEFESSRPEVASVVAATGVVTLHSNLEEVVTLRARALGTSVARSTTFACNLEPAVGDVDLGARTGVPVPAQRVGDTFQVPVTVNLGSQTLNAVDL